MGIYRGVTRGGAEGCSAPPLESELSSICIGFSLINDVRARGWPPPLENFLVTPMHVLHFFSAVQPLFCGNFTAIALN